jgi:hypothetical protein
MGRNNNLVPLPDAKGYQSKVKGIRSVGNPDTVWSLIEEGEFFFKFYHILPQNKVTALQYGRDCLPDFLGNVAILSN